MSNWEKFDTDYLLDSLGNDAESSRFGRIMLHRLNERLHALTDTIYKAHQGFSDQANTLFNDHKTISQKQIESNKEQAKAQNRLQWIVIVLTVVIAASTLAYTCITWESVSAMRDANEIQRQFLEIEKIKPIKAP